MVACEVWCHVISTLIDVQKRELHKLDLLNIIFYYPIGKSTISGIHCFYLLWSVSNPLNRGLILSLR
jgi:hypothetical protein